MVLRRRGTGVTTQATAAQKSHGVEQLLADVPPGETPDVSGAFPRLEETRLRELAAWGALVQFLGGEKVDDHPWL